MRRSNTTVPLSQSLLLLLPLLLLLLQMCCTRALAPIHHSRQSSKHSATTPWQQRCSSRSNLYSCNSYNAANQHVSRYCTSALQATLSKDTNKPTSSEQSEDGTDATIAKARVTFLLPANAKDTLSSFGVHSPVGRVPWLDVVQQLCQKCRYFSQNKVTADYVVMGTDYDESMLLSSDVLLAIALSSPEDIAYTQSIFDKRRAQNAVSSQSLCNMAIPCETGNNSQTYSLPSLVGPYDAASPSPLCTLAWTQEASGQRMATQMKDLFCSRSNINSDDYTLAIMLYLNQFCPRLQNQIDWVKHSIDVTWEKGPVRNAQEIGAMVTKCGDCIANCVKDENCRECLTKLTAIDTRDQVASYRTIVSYESDLLRDFTMCIMTKNNIFNCDATIPKEPYVPPIAAFRGEPLTEDIARRLMIGHLKDDLALEGSLQSPVSWEVACGANVAYDQFPSQNQLFYPAARGQDMWYDPVFRVETLDGRNIWCKRHYKVRPQKVPGTFRFSVLDNGITSDEFWTIVAVADDLSWIVFHYAGAARAVGQNYLGGLLCTPDGKLPDKAQLPEIWDAFRSAGIQPWELYRVNNDPKSPGAISAGPPPLDFFRKAVQEKRAIAEE
jgi:VDE lipocalin domain